MVVVHDRELKRICGVDKFVNEFNYEDLPQIQAKIPVHFSEEVFDASSVKDRKLACFDEVCQALGRTLLNTLGDTPINMELKTINCNIEEEVYKILKKHNKLDQVVWGFVDHKHAKKLMKIDPNVARFASLIEAWSIIVAYIFGVLPLLPLK